LKEDRKAELPEGNEVFGNGDIGNISSGMKTILNDIPLIFTGNRLSMAGYPCQGLALLEFCRSRKKRETDAGKARKFLESQWRMLSVCCFCEVISFHAYVKRGLYPEDWSSEPEGIIQGGE
jgi:hypothetical protein